MRRIAISLFAVFSCAASLIAADKPTLFRQPALSRTQIVFYHAGDLWSVSREGGEARRLTTAPGQEADPVFSPDGEWLAFIGEYDGNIDVFVMPATGRAAAADLPSRS